MATVKRLIAKNRSVVASLLVGWLLLCGMMPLLALDMSMDMTMPMEMTMGGDMVGSHSYHQSMSGLGMMTDESNTADEQHCCDVLSDSVLLVQHQFIDLSFSLSLVVAVCSLLFLWTMTTGRNNTYYCSFIPPPGPPIHQRLCVWLD